MVVRRQKSSRTTRKTNQDEIWKKQFQPKRVLGLQREPGEIALRVTGHSLVDQSNAANTRVSWFIIRIP